MLFPAPFRFRLPRALLPFAGLSVLSVLAVSFGAASSVAQPTAGVDARPNFLFVVFEDLSPRIGAYGDTVADTPVLDAFAAQAVLYTHAFTTAGVCAPSRAALMMGLPQQAVGAQHMRTTQGAPRPGADPLPYLAVPPPHVKAFPELLRAAGYTTTNNFKTDYQLGFGLHAGPFTIWDENRAAHPWRGREPGRPFFAMVNIMQTHESYLFDPKQIEPDDHPFAPTAIGMVRAWQRQAPDRTDPAAVTVPAFLPDTPEVRRDIARQYDNLHFAERELGRLLDELEQDGLVENTVVVVTSDHGDGLPRAKRSLYDSGLRVPLMVRLPGSGLSRGTRTDELVSFLDLAPTFLSLAGAAVPGWMQGRVFLGEGVGPERGYIHAALDRHDEVPDRQRAVRDARWKYIRNLEPHRPFFRPLGFRDLLGSMRTLWRGHEDGTLPPPVAQYFAADRPSEELYDTWTDPDEVDNLVERSEHAAELARLRRAYDRHAQRVVDGSATEELVMVQHMWGGLEQPSTATPVATAVGSLQSLVCPTEGASIGYRIDGGPWRLYTRPFEVQAGALVEAKAVRYGFRESDILRIEP